jgi:DNA-binding CsgD family transcriptional regulator
MSVLSTPFILINKDKEIIFQSDSFKKLVCFNHKNLGLCSAFLISALNINGGKECCWDVVENYQKSNENALWQIRDHKKNIKTILCKIELINVGDSSAIIALKIEPIVESQAPIAKSFFNNLYCSLDNENTYKKVVCKYFREHYNIKYVKWLSLQNKYPNVLEQKIINIISRHTKKYIYDIIIEHNKSFKIFHIFRHSDDSFLVIGKMKSKLDIHFVNILQTAIDTLDIQEDELLTLQKKQIKQGAFLELLTYSEKEILTYLQKGLSNKEIAIKRGVSINTIRNQVRSMMEKAGVNKRIKMILLA